MEAREYPIKDYAIIGNCESAALINSAGGIDWLCLPAFDAPSFFGALLDREKGGEFFIRPADEYRIERRYIDDTAILETRFITERGTLVLTDFFVMARQPRARFYDFTSLHPARKLARLVSLEEGDHNRSATRQLWLSSAIARLLGNTLAANSMRGNAGWPATRSLSCGAAGASRTTAFGRDLHESSTLTAK